MIPNIRKLLTSVDVLNTLHGGISEPHLSIQEQTERREIRVHVPGIITENLQIEVNNNTLSVFYFIPIISNGETIQVPQIIYSHAIPYFIEVSGIRAIHAGKELIVQLPFNELRDGLNRKIEIRKD